MTVHLDRAGYYQRVIENKQISYRHINSVLGRASQSIIVDKRLSLRKSFSNRV